MQAHKHESERLKAVHADMDTMEGQMKEVLDTKQALYLSEPTYANHLANITAMQKWKLANIESTAALTAYNVHTASAVDASPALVSLQSTIAATPLVTNEEWLLWCSQHNQSNTGLDPVSASAQVQHAGGAFSIPST